MGKEGAFWLLLMVDEVARVDDSGGICITSSVFHDLFLLINWNCAHLKRWNKEFFGNVEGRKKFLM
jgi:hypothetical protein